MGIKMEKSYFMGIIGALLGAFVATIPWILLYIYGNMMLSILAFVIGYGALYGYKLFHGVVDKNTSCIITIVSLISVTIATLVVIPLWILHNNGYVISFENLSNLYTMSAFKSAILRDFVISIVFTLLGISGVISKIKQEVS